MTIKDIAKKANVSVATVSRVMNEYKWVSPELRSRVLKVIEEENYRPNYNASVMATGKSNMIVIIVPDIMSPYFAQFTSILNKRLKAAGFATMLFQTDNNIAEETSFFYGPFARMADGIISVTDGIEDARLLKIIKLLREKDRPVLFVDRALPPGIADTATNDNIGGIRRAVELLHRKGHRKIAMIVGKYGLSVVRDKMKGFRLAMRACGLTCNENYVRTGTWTVETGAAETARLLRMSDPPTAIIACNNFICEGVLSELDRQKRKAGKDISVIGMEESCSDARLFSRLGVTTIKLDCERIAEHAASYMLERLCNREKTSYFTSTEFIMELIERDSVVDLTQK